VNANATTNSPNNTTMFANSTASQAYQPPANLVAMAASAVSSVGGSQPHNNMMPYLVLNFIIALQGIFPSKN
jgi:microcystin-dependent protein